MLDLIREDEASIKYIVDGVTSGTTGLVIEAVNKIEASLLSRGYNIKYLSRNLDVMLHGKQAQSKWIEKYLPESDAVLVFDTGYAGAREVEKFCKEKNIPIVKVKSKVLPKTAKIR